MPRSLIPGCAIRQSPMSMTSCERWARSPATPSSRTANCTRVRHPSPGVPPLAVITSLATGWMATGWMATGSSAGSSPGSGSTVTSRSTPASRRRCWPSTAALSARCAGSEACCQSQPPQPPGRAFGHGGATRSADGWRISTASARANRDVTSVTRATTRSPGSACRTNSTGKPAGLATHQPPCATSAVVTSTASPTSKPTGQSSSFWGRILPCEGITLARRPVPGAPWLGDDVPRKDGSCTS